MPYAPQDIYLRDLFESLDVGVLVADDVAFYVDVNGAACRLFDRSRADIIGHHLSEFIPGSRAAEVDLQWRAFLRDGVQTGVFSIQLPDLSSREFHFDARANIAPGLHCSFLTPIPSPAGLSDPHACLTVCAWTKRILFDGKWMPLESYLKQAHGISVTHGICPEAFRDHSAFSKK